MKKILLSFLCAIVASLSAMAQSVNFTDNLVVTINGESTDPMETTVNINLHEDGTIDFSLPNFCLSDGENLMPVGTIFIPNIALEGGEDGIYTFGYNGNLLITEGDMEGADTWIGPLLGEIPLKLTGKITMEKVYVSIDIDMMESLGQIIYVTFGDDNFGAEPEGYNFTDKLVVTINGESTDPMETTVNINLHEDGTFDFRLPNFCLNDGENLMPVGTIFIPNIALEGGEDDIYTFGYNGNLLITEGNMEGADTWIGPLLGEIPLKLTGKITMEKVYVSIDIDMMESLGQIIYVTFGDDNFGDESEGIKTIVTEGSAALYDLQGRRVRAAHNGVTIMNGKKVIR